MPTKPACPNDNIPVRPVSRLMLKTARLKIKAVITMLIQNVPNVSGNAARIATAAISKTRLDILVDPFGHQTAREEDKRQHQQAKPDRGRIGVRNVNSAEALNHPDEQRAKDSAVHIAEATENYRRERIEHFGAAHVGCDHVHWAGERASGGRHHRAETSASRDTWLTSMPMAAAVS